MKLARALQALTLLGLLGLPGLLTLWLLGGLAGWLPALALLLALIHVPAMALEFALQRHVNRADAVPPAGAWQRLRAWAAEAAGALWVFGWLLPWRWRRYPDHVPADAQGRRALVLVHGFVCNRGIWNPWWPRLLRSRVPCIAVNLEPLFGPIDEMLQPI